MRDLTVMVVEPDAEVRRDLVVLLQSISATRVVDYLAPATDLDEKSVMSTDLLVCGIPGGTEICDQLLPRIARLAVRPAVVFHGPPVNFSEVERACLNLELRYLGFLSRPLVKARLVRVLDLVRTNSRRTST